MPSTLHASASLMLTFTPHRPEHRHTCIYPPYIFTHMQRAAIFPRILLSSLFLVPILAPLSLRPSSRSSSECASLGRWWVTCELLCHKFPPQTSPRACLVPVTYRAQGVWMLQLPQRPPTLPLNSTDCRRAAAQWPCGQNGSRIKVSTTSAGRQGEKQPS
jgi:hypothetical protein